MKQILFQSAITALLVALYSFFINKREIWDAAIMFVITFILISIVLYIKHKYINKK